MRKLKERATRMRFAMMLGEKLRRARYLSGNDVKKVWKEFKDSMLETAQEVCGVQRRKPGQRRTESWNKEV